MTKIVFDHALSQAIVDTIREPLLVLDEDLRVVAASRSFYQTFKVERQDTEGRLLSELGGGQWDISILSDLLKRISPDEGVLDGYEVEVAFPTIGLRAMLLNARKVYYEKEGHTTILLAIEDISERRAIERERDQLLRDKDLLLQEMQHRVANSLQIIASILLMKARAVSSDETRAHLHDAHKRVLAVAAVQQHLHATVGDAAIDLPPYLTQLCGSLAGSMIGEGRPIKIDVRVDPGRAASGEAVSLGLIVTELVINSMKHAFPVEGSRGLISVVYGLDASGWKLTVSDDGVGRPTESSPPTRVGLGTSIVSALAEQLQARVENISSASGTSTSVTHAKSTQALEAA
jgi:two-component sensor histidine kinase